MTVYVDDDHENDLVTRISITGTLVMQINAYLMDIHASEDS
jgi:hypothetical protein